MTCTCGFGDAAAIAQRLAEREAIEAALKKAEKARDSMAECLKAFFALDSKALTMVREDANGVAIKLNSGQTVCQLFAEAFMDLLDEGNAENYVEAQFDLRGSGDVLTVTVQRPGRPTPHQKRAAAEKRLAEVEAQLRALQERDAAASTVDLGEVVP